MSSAASDPGYLPRHLGRWTAEQGRSYEVTEWVLGALIAECSEDAASERQHSAPDLARLGAIADRRAHYAAVRRGLSVNNPAAIQKVLLGQRLSPEQVAHALRICRPCPRTPPLR